MIGGCGAWHASPRFHFIERQRAMKHTTILGAALVVLALTISPSARAADATAGALSSGMKEGKPAVKSMGPIAFGPHGILFIADTKSAAIVAVATSSDTQGSDPKVKEAPPIKVEGI